MAAPEMVKARPVVAISPKLKHRGNLVTIVPLSTTEPHTIMPYHYEINLATPLPAPWNGNPFWAVGDHPMTVRFERLDLIRLKKDQYGKRRYCRHCLDEEDLKGVKRAVLAGIGFNDLLRLI